MNIADEQRLKTLVESTRNQESYNVRFGILMLFITQLITIFFITYKR